MKTRLIYFVVLFQAVLLECPKCRTQFRCDYEYSEEAGGWLKFQEIPATWYEARLRCRFEGTTLASPTPQLKTYLQNIVQSNPSVCEGIYTGISATYSTGDYASVEGIPLSKIPHNWSDCEPSGCHKENCLTLNKLGRLQVVNCNETYPYVCYKKFADIKMNPCGTIDDEYVLDNRTGSCYKFHRTSHSWNRAYMICRAEGGYLAVINSDLEATVLSEIFTRIPANTITSSWKKHVTIGFRDWDEHGEWLTIHGQTLTEAGYNALAMNSFDNVDGIEYCGCINKSGRLDDISCDKLFSFICEKDPNSLLC